MRRACVSMLSACLVFVGAGSSAPVPGATRLPGPELNLRLAAPIATWDEAVPLGNGLMGGLLWGGDATRRSSSPRTRTYRRVIATCRTSWACIRST